MSILNIYCDEVIRPNSNELIILGALFIKEIDIIKILNLLENNRCLDTINNKWYYDYQNCPNNNVCKEKWHDKNNTIIHFTDIHRSRERKIIAKKWLSLIKNRLKGRIKFSILIIDLEKLDCAHFGRNKTDLNIYNRFFRTLLNGGVKYLYSKDAIKIKNVFHDEGSQEKHYYFPELNLEKLEIETPSGYIIENKKIIFVNDDHRKYLKNNEMEFVKHSHLIQLIDIILGSFSQLFLNLSGRDEKKEVAEVMREVFMSLINKEWKYPYSVSFFPRYSYDELVKINQFSLKNFKQKKHLDKIITSLKFQDNFYNKSTLAMPRFNKYQHKLTEWI